MLEQRVLLLAPLNSLNCGGLRGADDVRTPSVLHGHPDCLGVLLHMRRRAARWLGGLTKAANPDLQVLHKVVRNLFVGHGT